MVLPALPDAVVIRDVGPRDGLQPEAPVAVEDRVRLVEALVAAGVTRIEAVAFVSPKAVPAMAGAAEVLAAVPRPAGVRYAALVPNVRGAELALECDVDELTVTASMSETYSQRNVRMSIDESADAIAGICAVAGDVPVDAVLSCSFGSPYEGEVPPADVAALAQRLRDSGCAAITCADTTGMATPRRVAEVVDAVGTDIGLHLHETRGTALVSRLRRAAARRHPVRHVGGRARRLAVRRRGRRQPRHRGAGRPARRPRAWPPASTSTGLIDAAHLAGELVGPGGAQPGGGGRSPHPAGRGALTCRTATPATASTTRTR